MRFQYLPIGGTDARVKTLRLMNAAEVQHWAKDLQVETYELRAAINMVDPRLSGLRRFLGKSVMPFAGSTSPRSAKTSDHVRPCNLKRQQRDLMPVLRRPVEPAEVARK